MPRSAQILAALLTFLALIPAAQAEGARPGGGRTGLEVLLEAESQAFYDRSFQLRGTAYEVLGLAELRALPGATIRARCGGPWAETTSDARGFFEIEMSVPASPEFPEDEGPQVELMVMEGEDERAFELPISLASPLRIVARTDRVLYEPGETVRFWVRVVDARSGRPLSGIPVDFGPFPGRAGGPPVLSSAAGVATLEVPMSESAVAQQHSVSVHVGEGELATSSPLYFRVGERPVADLFVSMETTPATVPPGGQVEVRVTVLAPSGFPVRGALVFVEGGGVSQGARTSADGLVTLSFDAPAFTGSERGAVTLRGNARHPGYGYTTFRGSFGVRWPESVDVSALLPRGGIVPDVSDSLILSVGGSTPATGAGARRLEVRGPAVEGGSVTAVVDRHGFARIPMRASAGTYARHVGGSSCSGGPATTVEVLVEGPTSQQTELCVPILDVAEVLPRVVRPAVGPGERIQVDLRRRRGAERRHVVVELFSLVGGGLELVDVTVAVPTARRVTFTAPDGRLGRYYVRARPVRDEHSAEGVGVFDPLLVRPALPSFPRLEVDQQVYPVGGTAQLTIHSAAGAPESHAAVLVRDLAQHEGEVPFRESFLSGSLARAILDPSTPEADLLVRGALAAMHRADEAGSSDEDGDEEVGAVLSRDPVIGAENLLGSEAGQWMVALESLLESALEAGTLEEVVRGEGARRTFVDDALDQAETDDEPETLGGGRVSVPMLTHVDPSFTYEAAARRVARRRLVRLLGVLARYADPEDNTESRPRGRGAEPPERWLSELVRQGMIEPTDLHDPWGGTYVLRRTGRRPVFTIAVEAEGYELLSPGPDGRVGTPDDVNDPLSRVVAEGTIYALASGEDRLMAQLSALSPGRAALDALLEAYTRLNDEALEEMVGDAFGYGGLGLRGTGRGGGGSGYGRGAGGLRGRRSAVPRIRAGGASPSGTVRQDFPATLLFRGEVDVDPSGRTAVEIPLADAATTYIVEAILWRQDGWVWSAATEIRVDQALLVDAPVPSAATVGDDILLPLRVANRSKRAHSVRLRVTDGGALRLDPIATGMVTVPPEDAVDVPVKISPRRAGRGTLTIAAVTESGDPVDAVRRPMVVHESRRAAEDEVEGIVRGRGEVSLLVPDGATAEGQNEVSLSVGPAIFLSSDRQLWNRWVEMLTATESPGRASPSPSELEQLARGGSPVSLASLVGTYWIGREVPDASMSRAIEVMSDHVAGLVVDDTEEVRVLSRMLLLLAPALRHDEVRRSERAALVALARQLRIAVESGAALFADAPWVASRAAAALLWSAPPGDGGARAEELLDRARAAVVQVDEEAWVEGGNDDGGDELFAATCLLALSEVRVGRDEEGYQLLASMARLFRSGGGDLPEVAFLRPEDRAVAAAAAAALGGGRAPEAVTVVVDGDPRQVELHHRGGTVGAPELGQGGTHRVEVVGAGRSMVLLHAAASYSVGWNAPPPLVGPFAVSIVGEPGAADHRSELELVIRNTVPRLVREPIVEIALPAGVEIDEQARAGMSRWSARRPDVSGRTLRLYLQPLGPTQDHRVLLPWSWTVAGRLHGLGVMARAADRPSAISIAPSRAVEVSPASRGGAR